MTDMKTLAPETRQFIVDGLRKQGIPDARIAGPIALDLMEGLNGADADAQWATVRLLLETLAGQAESKADHDGAADLRAVTKQDASVRIVAKMREAMGKVENDDAEFQKMTGYSRAEFFLLVTLITTRAAAARALADLKEAESDKTMDAEDIRERVRAAIPRLEELLKDG